MTYKFVHHEHGTAIFEAKSVLHAIYFAAEVLWEIPTPYLVRTTEIYEITLEKEKSPLVLAHKTAK